MRIIRQPFSFGRMQIYQCQTLSRSPRGRPYNAPAAFIHPCQPTVASKPPSGPGWAHELKHDGYRLQIHVRMAGYGSNMNGADWSKRYPLIVQDAARIKGSAILDAEAVWLDSNGMADFEALHSRSNDARATALAFDLLMLDEEDMRRKPYVERKAALRKLLRGDRGIQYVEHAEGHGDRLFDAVCTLALRVSFQRSWTRPIDRGSRKPGSKSKIRKRQQQQRSRWNFLMELPPPSARN